ncbi:MAG TPA: EAL domain-containing protein [Rhodocyclaceae bacterium]|nr:EAL domain-containing protein [Rhodocyclaceae bacterium]
MEIKKRLPHLSSSLYFRILAPLVPIVILMALLGSVVFSIGLNTASHYGNERIQEDLGRNSREIYNLCDSALQNLLLEGRADDSGETRIRKGTTLGKIEEYAAQNNLQVLVYSGTADNVLLNRTQIEPGNVVAATHQDQEVKRIQKGDTIFYARHLEFELWHWDIVLIKDGKAYAEFVGKIKQSYYVIVASLLIVCLALIFYFRRIIHKPIRSIIASIQADGLPDYKGIYEFEFLSNIIREAAQKEQQKQVQISYQASHDALTGLINRREFERRLEQALQEAKFNNTCHSVLYLDLDQFKIVNDTCGHNAGDALLQQLTTALQTVLRQSDVLARLGGDEFGVLLENCPDKPAYRIAESLRQAVSSFRFVWMDKSFIVGVSIGLGTFGDDELSVNDIFSIVDGACYVAKDLGRNRIHVYSADDNQLAERKGLMNWVGRISAALEENRMILFRQKIVPLQDGPDQSVHYEMLLRMRDENGRQVPPMAFIPAAERYNLMPAIDFWVIRTALAYYEELYRQDTTCSLAINLSGATLGDERLLPYIREQLLHFDIPPTAICFEVTETTAIAKLGMATALMHDLKKLGCRFALDDFGSGMSSFGYLKNLPIDFIKIDGAFVRNLVSDSVDRAMVEAITNIAHVMGVKTIAEFVETEAIAEELTRMGVDYAQGYWFGRPEPIELP